MDHLLLKINGRDIKLTKVRRDGAIENISEYKGRDGIEQLPAFIRIGL